MEVAPEPVISPDRVMVWLPVIKGEPLQLNTPPLPVMTPLVQLANWLIAKLVTVVVASVEVAATLRVPVKDGDSLTVKVARLVVVETDNKLLAETTL